MRKKHFRSHVGGTYYGRTSSPEVRVYNCTGGGSGAAFYLRLEGHGSHNGGSYFVSGEMNDTNLGNIGDWKHCVLHRSGSTITFFINGIYGLSLISKRC